MLTWPDDRTDEGMNKWGYVSTTPGSSLMLRINNIKTAHDTARPVRLMLIYLRSYEHMGTASVACVSGCACNTTTLDGHNSQSHNSVNEFHVWHATQSSDCVIGVEVLNATQSGQHKVKLLGLVVTEEADRQTWYDGAKHGFKPSR